MESKNLCTICLFPGAMTGGRHKCTFTNFCCPSPSHDPNSEIHMLICEQHKEYDKNKKLLVKYKDCFIQKCPVMLPDFSKILSLISGLVYSSRDAKLRIRFGFPNEIPEVHCRAISLTQQISIGGVHSSILFDNCCGKSVAKKSAIEKLIGIGRLKQTLPGPLILIGVGDMHRKSMVNLPFVYQWLLGSWGFLPWFAWSS